MATDLTGMVVGRLTVLRRVGDHVSPSGQRKTQWQCKCSCGTEKTVLGPSLTQQRTKSCGCIQREGAAERGRASLYKHGKSRDGGIYTSWQAMKGRCQNPADDHYARYGAKGITVCQQWRVFENFFADMGSTWFEGATIDRIENGGNYEPSNCQWLTRGGVYT